MMKEQMDIVYEDNEMLYQTLDSWQALSNKAVLVTGGTGMLAACLVRFLVFLNQKDQLGINVVVLVRNQDKAKRMFAEIFHQITLVVQDVCEPVQYKGNIDYVVHAASSASPYHIKHDPVGIIKANVQGTLNLLELVRNKNIRNFMFLSTREVYGRVEDLEYLTEQDFGTFDPLDSRSCYPESKRLAETLLQAYATQYQVPYSCVRIAHSYGPVMFLNDGRVMSDLVGDVVHSRPIVLNSDGSAMRSFCYVTDAVSAMLLVLLKGEQGQAFNIANETEEISILQLSHLLSDLKEGTIPVKHKIVSDSAYCQYQRTKLDVAKIEGLGWLPKVSLREGLEKTLAYMEAE
ncbi:NAD-dependent epimerase/dehydratase family protein [Vibrio maerlii]|uniref:NAD-dependent epimerase/dehydratase family protein n=1 Tax=Vibrio maerlii TaxID=2231648 RepID=UPI000E3E22FC|nr:NAD-dependent epimerase/dehydratase family protein [Vibrio maerlii]